MNITGTEIETKFHISDLKKIELRLQSIGAHLIQPRQFELNLRYDLPDRSLGKSYRVLRLRQDENTVLTYKGPGSDFSEGIRSREEWEVTVSDFETMKKILESLGYVIQFTYEKYRTTYVYADAHVMLDEMPFGAFVEIEGRSPAEVKNLADGLNLDKARAIPESYLALFERVKTSLVLTFRDLTFENFTGLNVPVSALGVKLAD